jgi:hypothetical protein
MLTSIIAAAALATLALSGSAFAGGATRTHVFTAQTTVSSASRAIPVEPVRIKSYAKTFHPGDPIRVYNLGR